MRRKRIYRENIDERQLVIECAVEEAAENALVIGRKQGRKQGMIKSSTRTAKAMLADGFNPTLVARYTKLPIEQIRAMRSA